MIKTIMDKKGWYSVILAEFCGLQKVLVTKTPGRERIRIYTTH